MKYLTTCLACIMAVFIVGASAHAAEKTRFATPPWPGVEVKTEITSQILETLDYPTEQLQIGLSIAYSGFSSGEVDAFLGAWMPQQTAMLEPLVEKGVVEKAAVNLDTAVISLCVPKFVGDEGVKSFADLDKYADKFGHHMYNIEAGSAMHTNMEEIIKNDVAGLGDWTQTGVTTPAMLKEVTGKADRGEWVVFGCWKPHWMNLMMDMTYLTPVPGTEKFASNSKVYTVVRGDMKDTDPDIYRFLKQIKVTSQAQSEWIRDYGQKEIPVDKVAKDWISANKDTVAQWLDGVKAADGTPAMEKINEAY
ncbi:glycine betaine ABC transporter substrate-binding protein [Oceanidesulfovibrio marinus]|uniref:Glycine/betaine ABC transporter substrate-binding protein n=1 Tax=Oceanidesulfovibrio marinus TaxID=370038 RepID=A0ABX6NI35_9BACT|nr:glycine betaine ABC transporter substrate-binding protein [Oceanidesulfovibrio marinus]QJT09728.1 glycine/betaine ABC transporter substrate-binding protein [Oceanidesulfovibrio marinus]